MMEKFSVPSLNKENGRCMLNNNSSSTISRANSQQSSDEGPMDQKLGVMTDISVIINIEAPQC